MIASPTTWTSSRSISPLVAHGRLRPRSSSLQCYNTQVRVPSWKAHPRFSHYLHFAIMKGITEYVAYRQLLAFLWRCDSCASSYFYRHGHRYCPSLSFLCLSSLNIVKYLPKSFLTIITIEITRTSHISIPRPPVPKKQTPSHEENMCAKSRRKLKILVNIIFLCP